jgi:C4-dicarboxylate-specific signal transduction histidine kinase
VSEEKLLREKGLAFFGSITASFSHEINNVMAIIGELAGLMEDLLRVADQGHPPQLERFRGISERIGTQVKRGEEMTKRLNRFAHTMDEPVKTIDMTHLLVDLIALSERPRTRRRARLETRFPEETILLVSNPFLLQQAIFSCMELVLAASHDNQLLRLILEKQEGGARITVAGENPIVQTDEATLSFLPVLMDELGGKVEVISTDNGGLSVVLSIPYSIPGDSKNYINNSRKPYVASGKSTA